MAGRKGRGKDLATCSSESATIGFYQIVQGMFHARPALCQRYGCAKALLLHYLRGEGEWIRKVVLGGCHHCFLGNNVGCFPRAFRVARVAGVVRVSRVAMVSRVARVARPASVASVAMVANPGNVT